MRLIIRYARITWVFLKYLVFKRSQCLGARLRPAFEELGPTFIKIGQLLSTRHDLLSDEDCRELRKLLDTVKPIPFKKVRELLMHDFGKTPEALFKHFAQKPIASASVSQVHKATTIDGRIVAVKIRRPHIGRTIQTDMRILRQLAVIAQVFSPALRLVKAPRLVDQFREWLLQEIDFRHEAKNVVEVKNFLTSTKKGLKASTGTLIIPELITEWCSENVLALEFIEGTPLNQCNKNVALAAKTYVNVSLRPLFEDKPLVFQADPHPANIIVLEKGDVAIVDFGLVGHLTLTQVQRARELFIAIYAQNIDETIKSLLAMVEADYNKHAVQIRPEIEAFLKHSSAESAGYWFMELFKIMLKHNISYPADFALFGRGTICCDGLIHLADPSLTAADLIGNELRAALLKKMITNVTDANYPKILYNITTKIRDSPELLSNLIDKYGNDPARFFKDVKEAVA